MTTDAVSGDFRNVTTLRGALADGTEISVSGTLTGPRMIEKIVGINGFDLEVPLSDHMAVFTYADRPGCHRPGRQLLGPPGSTSAACRWPATTAATSALMILNADSALPQDVAAQIATAVGAEHHAIVDL
jgi:D-3-phosphoglycerate dehydrogenase